MRMKFILAMTLSAILIGGGMYLWSGLSSTEDPIALESTLNSQVSSAMVYEDARTRYEERVWEEDPRSAIALLQQDADESPLVSAVCHDLLHAIGSEALKKYSQFDTAIGYHSDYCNSGYLHGLFEAYFTSAEYAPAMVSTLCNSGTFLKRPFDVWQCHHGLGHGFMYQTDGDVARSLELCEGVGEVGMQSCQNGVYMELFNAEVLPLEKSILAENPLAFCTSMPVATTDCYTYVATAWSQLHNIPFEDMFALCRNAEYGYDGVCVAGIGSEAMKRNMENSEGVFALCLSAPNNEYQRMCTRGLVGIYLNQKGSLEAGEELCTSAPDRLKSTCRERVAGRESFFAPLASVVE